MKHLDRLDILDKQQNGFRQKHSCESQLINTIEQISCSVDKKRQVDYLVLDFAKAFDTVPHQRLLYKLHFYGIRNNTLLWIQNWLTARTQRVVVDGNSSDKVKVNSGVPQGTVLGPLMFLIYINDVNEQISSEVKLFADDCLLFREIANKNDNAILQKDLNTLVKWSDTWQMSFNIVKCSVLTMSRTEEPNKYKYSMKGSQLERKKKTRISRS